MSSAISSELVALYRSVKDTDNTAYVVTGDLCLVRTNETWKRFALANDGAALLARWTVGHCILDAFSSDLRGFYRAAFETALRTGKRWEHDYDCSSADVFRHHRLVAFPAGNLGLVVTSSLLIERTHERFDADGATYERDGVITMCASCRRARAVRADERWDWVPALVRDLPPNVSHGLCPPCARCYAV